MNYLNIFNKNLDYQNFGILYRTNAQSRVMEESLRKLNIPQFMGDYHFIKERNQRFVSVF